MNIFAQTSGYVPATAQEALLQNYLGERQAAYAATVADRWRQPGPAQVTDNHPTPLTAEPMWADGRNPEFQPPPAPPSPTTDSSASSTSSTSSTDTASSSTPIARAPTERSPPQPESGQPQHGQHGQHGQWPRRQPHLASQNVASQNETNKHRPPPFCNKARNNLHNSGSSTPESLDDLDLLAALQEKAIFFHSPPQFLNATSTNQVYWVIPLSQSNTCIKVTSKHRDPPFSHASPQQQIQQPMHFKHWFIRHPCCRKITCKNHEPLVPNREFQRAQPKTESMKCQLTHLTQELSGNTYTNTTMPRATCQK